MDWATALLVFSATLSSFLLLQCLCCLIFCGKTFRKKRSTKNADPESRDSLQDAKSPLRIPNAVVPLPPASPPPPQEQEPFEPHIPSVPTPPPPPTPRPQWPPPPPEDPSSEERHRQVSSSLMATREPLYSGAQESPWEQQGVDLPRSARQKHIYEGELTVAAAEEKSASRYGNVFANTVLEEAKAYDRVFFDGFGNKIVTRNKVRTVQCRRNYGYGGGWSGNYIGRCYGVFEPGGHLLYKTTLRTAEMRAHTAGLTDALTLA